MEHRNLNLTLISATGLKKSRFTGKSNVYAVAFISDATGKHQKQRTSTDKTSDTDPTWNFPMKFVINEAVLGMTLVVKIKAEGLFGGKNLREVHAPVKELLEGFKGKANGKPTQTVCYQVLRKPSGKPNGVLNFNYDFGEKFTTMGEQPVGYGYQNQHPECVYYPRRPRPVVPPRRCSSMGFGFGNSSMGFGFGTGLVRGALVNR